MRLKLIKSETNFDFFGISKATLGLSIFLIIASVGTFFAMGLNYGIDFRGGSLIIAETTEPADTSNTTNILEGLDLGDFSVTEISSTEVIGDEQHLMMIRIEQQDDDPAAQNESIKAVKAALTDTYPDIIYQQTDSVGAKVSGELIKAGVLAVILAVAAVLFYIWLRFEWQFSVGAVAALIHDVLITIGIFCVTQVEFNLTIIAAILTIVGYSLNDTVVVFDRVRENLRKYKQMDLKDLLNLSINETLSRTIMTSVTTLIALFALYFLGGAVISGFTFAMIFGVIIGTYSSIFIASVIVLYLGVKRDWDKQDGGAGTQFADVDA